MQKSILPLICLVFVCFSTVAFGQDANPFIYTEIIPTSSGLPYNPTTDTRETFVAPNGKTVEVLVKGPQGSGTYSRAIAPGETPDTYFPAVVNEAIQANAHHLVIPKGVYQFQGPQLCTDLQSPQCNQPTSCNVNQYWNCAPHWVIGQYPQGQTTVPSISDLDIDGSGSELDFAAPVVGIWILQTERLRLRNFTIDWPALPIASLGTIVPDPLNSGHNALVIDEKYPVMDAYRGGPVAIQAVDPWDSKLDPPGTFGAKSNNNFETYWIFDNAPQPTYVGKTKAGLQTFSCESCNFQNSPTDPTCSFFLGCANFDNFAIGSRVIVRHYTYNGFVLTENWSNDVTLENITIRTGPGNGISVQSGGGYRGFRLANSQIERGPGRIIATASDALDLALQADAILENNNIGYQGDDSMAIYQVITPITNANGAQVTVTGYCDPDPMDVPVTGDQVAIFDSNYVYKATARVTAASSPVCGTANLTLDRAIEGLNSSYSMVDLTQQATARFIIRNNYAHECRCHGIYVGAPYGLIDNNMYYDNSEGSVSLFGGNGTGPGATNLTLSNNTISYPGQSAQYLGAVSMIAPDVNGNILQDAVFEKIKLSNNVFEQMPGPAIIATSAHYFSLSDNSVTDSNQVRKSPQDFGSLSTLDSVLLYQADYGTVCGTLLSGTTAGPIGIDPTDHKVVNEPACP
jgi:hypothetical protein